MFQLIKVLWQSRCTKYSTWFINVTTACNVLKTAESKWIFSLLKILDCGMKVSRDQTCITVTLNKLGKYVSIISFKRKTNFSEFEITVHNEVVWWITGLEFQVVCKVSGCPYILFSYSQALPTGNFRCTMQQKLGKIANLDFQRIVIIRPLT